MGAAYLRGPHAATADAVMANIRGAEVAKAAIRRVRDGHAPADALFDELQQTQSAGDAGRVQGFMRELQKALERSA